MANQRELGIQERANRLLLHFIRKQAFLNQRLELGDSILYLVIHANDGTDLLFLANMLQEQGFLNIEGSNNNKVSITPNGYIKAEELSNKRSDSVQGFVAMSFDHSMQDAWNNGLQVGINNAGYRALRVDKVDYNDKIDDEIIAQIKKSKFLVADFTGQRGGVYFEAGHAMGMGIPLIFTCREDDFKNVHFDIRQFNFIVWHEHDELAMRLKQRIEATIGEGPVKKDYN